MSLVIATAAAALTIAACGSSSNNSSTTSGGTSNANASASTGSGDSHAAAIAAATARPTQIQVTTPIGKPIPTGKTIVYIPCPAPNCVLIGNQVRAAASAVGWNVKTVTPTGSTATADINAFQQAVNDKPDGIVYVAYPAAVVQRELQAAKAAGIPVVGVNSAEPVGSLPGVIAQPGNTASIARLEAAGGRLMGLLAKPGDGIAFVEVTGFIPVGQVEAAVKQAATQACPSCHYYLKEINVTQLANATKTIANFVQATPNLKYVFLVDYATFGLGLKAQLQAVGASGVKVLASDVNQQGLADVKDGSLFVAGSFDQDAEQAYSAIDALARHFVGKSTAQDNLPMVPYWFTTAKAPAAWSPAAVENTRGLFLKLWGK